MKPNVIAKRIAYNDREMARLTAQEFLDITAVYPAPSAESAAALVRAWDAVFGEQMEAGDD